MSTLAIVHGGGKQRGGQRQAQNQYDSGYFGLKKEYAEEVCDGWVLFSEKYGLIAPDQLIGSYDTSLQDMSPAEESQWVSEIRDELRREVLGSDGSVQYDQVVVLASERYVEALQAVWDTLKDLGIDVRAPLPEQGGIGYQQGWLRRETDRQ